MTLKISPAVSVKKVPSDFGTTMDYILFPDDKEKDIYYALAERPTYQAVDNKPAFNLTWYFGANQVDGAICTFTVALPMPTMSDPAAIRALSEALNGDEATTKVAQTTFALCQALEAKKTDEAAKLQADLGFDAAAVARSTARYDNKRDYKQFLPLIKDTSIRSVPFKTGKVTVQAFANHDAYTKGTPAYDAGSLSTTPSLVNSNAAVVTFNLESLGANLFWHGLGGPPFGSDKRTPAQFNAEEGGVSVISVTYSVEFDGLLPEATATVTLSQNVIAKLKTAVEERRGSWGRTYQVEVVRGKEYSDSVKSATQVVIPAVASERDGEAVRTLLTDWAGKQLEDMVKAKLPEVKLDALSLDNVRSLEAKGEQSRTYTLTQGVTVPKNPQGQLPKVSAVAGTAPLDNFFQLIDLNKQPFFKVGVTVNPPHLEYLKQRSIERLAITDLSYVKTQLFGAGGPVTTMVYRPDTDKNPDDVTLKGTFDIRIPEDERLLAYNYLVSYTDGTPSLQVKGNKLIGTNYLDLSGVDLGVLSVSLNTIDLPWKIIDSATVEMKYGNWQKKIALQEGTPAFVAKPLGKSVTEKLKYQVTLNPISGDPVKGEWQEVTPDRGNVEIQLQSPLGDSKRNVKFALVQGAQVALLRVEYTFKSTDADRVFEQTFELDKSATTGKPVIWQVPSLSKHPSSFRVLQANVDDNDLEDQALTKAAVAEVTSDFFIRVGPKAISKF